MVFNLYFRLLSWMSVFATLRSATSFPKTLTLFNAQRNFLQIASAYCAMAKVTNSSSFAITAYLWDWFCQKPPKPRWFGIAFYYVKEEHPAVSRFREYLRCNTMHPSPDYTSAVAFLKQQAEDIGLNFSVVEPGSSLLRSGNDPIF